MYICLIYKWLQYLWEWKEEVPYQSKSCNKHRQTTNGQPTIPEGVILTVWQCFGHHLKRFFLSEAFYNLGRSVCPKLLSNLFKHDRIVLQTLHDDSYKISAI